MWRSRARGLTLALLALSGLTLAAFSPWSHASAQRVPTTHPKARVAEHAVAQRLLPNALTSGLATFTTTPVRFTIRVNDRAGGVDHRPMVYGAWDPSNGDGEVAVIAAGGGMESTYGASRVVNHHSWSLISGHWYRVGFAQQEIGQVLAVIWAIRQLGAVQAIASMNVAGTMCSGYAGQFSQTQLQSLVRQNSGELGGALVGVRRLRYRIYVGGGHACALDVRTVIASDRALNRTDWAIRFPVWGTPLAIRPPVPASVLPGPPPAGGLLPL
ncbi:hypothetical protein [Ferrimicrobium sp.]|uniref:hypothetical protein n=1 Tax=Ferrimicrobium sp. TaxID=2926050 RepID=UPI00261619F1|nr:hypothetical protein [Ferrimicrobium sp.]MCL5973791.1 hypothetical protein [Actinomycetota bacterium]